MKTTALTLIAAFLLSATAFAHERLTVGPNGGRVSALDSMATPSAEFSLSDDKFIVTLLDKTNQPIPLGEQVLTVTTGDRSNPQKLNVERKDGAFVISPKPAGEDYWLIFQLKETPKARAMTFRVHYQTEKCGECGKPEWLCVCGAKISGGNVTVPATLDGLLAEIRKHDEELQEAFKKKNYAALDEVTQAFTVLLKALPAKSGTQAATIQPSVEALIANLAAIAEANASRDLGAAAKNLASFNSTLASLKKNHPW